MERTLESIRALAPAEDKPSAELSDDMIRSIPPDVAQKTAKRIRDAAELGDVTQLKSVAQELSSQIQSLAPLGNQIIELSEEFDFDAITQLADRLENS